MSIIQTATYHVRPEEVDTCLTAMREFVAHVSRTETGTLRYQVFQQKDDPTRFMHFIVFEDEPARDAHSKSAAVSRFTDVLNPRCVEPVVFTEYSLAGTVRRAKQKGRAASTGRSRPSK